METQTEVKVPTEDDPLADLNNALQVLECGRVPLFTDREVFTLTSSEIATVFKRVSAAAAKLGAEKVRPLVHLANVDMEGKWVSELLAAEKLGHRVHIEPYVGLTAVFLNVTADRDAVPPTTCPGCRKLFAQSWLDECPYCEFSFRPDVDDANTGDSKMARGIETLIDTLEPLCTCGEQGCPDCDNQKRAAELRGETHLIVDLGDGVLAKRPVHQIDNGEGAE